MLSKEGKEIALVFHTPFPHPLCGKSGALPWLHAACLQASPERLFSLWGQETLNLEVLEMERLWGLERTHVFIVLELNTEKGASAQAAPDLVSGLPSSIRQADTGERH